MFKWCRDSAVLYRPHMLRFMAHLVLFFRALGITEKARLITLLALAQLSLASPRVAKFSTNVVGVMAGMSPQQVTLCDPLWHVSSRSSEAGYRLLYSTSCYLLATSFWCALWWRSLPSVLWRCWLGGRKGIRPVKNWVVRCWHGYLSGARCWLAYGPADATASHCLLLQ